MPRRRALPTLDEVVEPKVVAYTVDDLTYDPTTHTSRLPDGSNVPHVTSILSAVGVSTDFEEMASFGPRIADRIEVARALGTAVHADCHAYDDDDLVWASIDPRVAPFVEAWGQLRLDHDLVPVVGGRERRIFCPLYRYTGILDGVFECRRNRRMKRILLDIKTGEPDSAACHLQTAGYERGWSAAHPNEPIDERWAVRLMPDMKIPYRIKNYTERPDGYMDQPKFLACVTVYNEQPSRRKKVA